MQDIMTVLGSVLILIVTVAIYGYCGLLAHKFLKKKNLFQDKKILLSFSTFVLTCFLWLVVAGFFKFVTFAVEAWGKHYGWI